jgi:cell division septum initiation protein DivIVA
VAQPVSRSNHRDSKLSQAAVEDTRQPPTVGDVQVETRPLDATPPSGLALGTGFRVVKRGFDPEDVRRYTEAAGAELRRLAEQNRQLKMALDQAKSAAQPVEAEVVAVETAGPTGELAPGTINEQRVAEFLGSETTNLLDHARSAAAEVLARAEAKAAALVADASRRADLLTSAAVAESSKIRTDAEQDASDIVANAHASRDQILLRLADRRDLADTQIRELAHGCTTLTKRLTEIEEMTRRMLSKVAPIITEPRDFVNLDLDRPDDQIAIDRKAVHRLTAKSRRAG